VGRGIWGLHAGFPFSFLLWELTGAIQVDKEGISCLCSSQIVRSWQSS
jgi:hypothetical protein